MQPVPVVPLADDFQPFGSGNVRPHRIRFDPSDPAFLSRDTAGLLRFRVLAPAETVEAMVLVRTTAVGALPMRRIGAAGSVALWEGVLVPPAERFLFSLAFRLEGDVPVYLASTGVTSGIERIDRFSVDVANVPVHDVPDWASGAVIYQIFPERFAPSGNGVRRNLETWDTRPSSRSFLGGDLPGISERVPYLVDLGIDVVYLNPIFTSPSNHKYDTVDYRSVDPSLGGDAALVHLVEVLHEAGIRLILDVSLNHCHPRFFAFADVVKNGPSSPHAGWFDIHEWPVRVRHRPHLIEPGTYWGVQLSRLQQESGITVEEVGGDGPVMEPTYGAWYGVPLMPRIDLQHPEARRYMLDTARYWIREFGIDGWRMDVVRYIDHDFWAEVRREMRLENPDAYLLAEVMGDARRWLRGDEFDGVMNYTFRQLAVDYFATGAIDTETFLEGLLEMAAMYSPAATLASQNLLGSHDTPRFVTLAGGDPRSLLLATLVQLTIPGAPGLYYGDELGMEGAADPDNRRGMTWDRTGSDHHDAVRSLIALRKAHPSLRKGEWRLVSVVGGAFAYQRRLANDGVVVAINASDSSVLLPVRGAHPLWTVGEVLTTPNGSRLGPRSGAVMTATA